MRRILLLAAAATLAACMSQPTTTPVESAPVTAAPAADASVTAPAADASVTAPAADASVAAPAAAPASDSSTATAADATRGKIPSGYRMEKRNGKELYCRNVTTLGSRFAQKTCFTRKQLEEIQKRTDSAMGDLDKGMKVCTGIEGCGQN